MWSFVVFVEADPLVPVGRLSVLEARGHRDGRGLAGLRELERVGEEVLEELAHLGRVGSTDGNGSSVITAFVRVTWSSRSESTSRATRPRSTLRNGCAFEVTRENVRRSSMRPRIRSAAFSMRWR
jgi:hypothetical protein